MADSACDVIAASNFAGSTSSLTFTGIPQTYKHLKIIANLCSVIDAGSYNYQSVYMRLNGDSTAGTYRFATVMMGNATYSSEDTNASYANVGLSAGDSYADLPAHSPLIIDMFNYSANEPTTWIALGGFTKNDNNNVGGEYQRASGGVATAGSGSDWGISQIEIYGSNLDFTSTSRVTILGLAD